MQYVILGLLLGGPLSLYDLQKRFAASVSLFYSASSGSIQRSLQNLVADGAVTVGDVDDTRRGRKLYSITSAGRARWRDWMLSEIPASTDAETTILAKVFLLGRLDEPTDRAVVLDRIRGHVAHAHTALQKLAADVDARASGLSDEDRKIFAYQRATLDYGVRGHLLLAQWIDEVGEMR
ncbi:PadR family transcriptional regulator [uncultured Aeromicrobium sp.]|uniref:PadR family transcriptional regulator n=1 Tax=uncultured Aeromicrobium sp. TaxID=337820 RepID=UPI0025F1396B|nr:helix-turn-helix transcriptional regulator [uncultured Aeromicrobium sp.]